MVVLGRFSFLDVDAGKGGEVSRKIRIFVGLTKKDTKMHAYVFPGQGAQFVGMGKDLYDNVPLAKELFEKANEILGSEYFPLEWVGCCISGSYGICMC